MNMVVHSSANAQKSTTTEAQRGKYAGCYRSVQRLGSTIRMPGNGQATGQHTSCFFRNTPAFITYYQQSVDRQINVKGVFTIEHSAQYRQGLRDLAVAGSRQRCLR